MVAHARAFECAVCGRPLSAGRVRQGVRTHPDCRQSPDRSEARAVVETMPLRTQDPELRELFALAAVQARELAENLERLRALRSDAQR